MKMKQLLSALLCVMLLWASAAVADTYEATPGEPHDHVWVNATCTTPKTCSVCGLTEGEALGHSWTEATCTTPRTCSVCGATEGVKLSHKWKPLEGGKHEETLLRSESEGELTHTDYVSITDELVCERCGVTDEQTFETSFKGEDHVWTAEGTCSQCGYACTHSKSEIVPDECTDTYVKGVEENELTHTDYYVNHDVLKCSVCGAKFTKDVEGSAPNQPHQWNAEGTCSQCGYACTHSDRTEATCQAPETCKACGMTLSGLRDHRWMPFEGGKHEETHLNSVPENESTHTDYYTVTDELACIWCGAKTEMTSEGKAEGKPHEWNAEGTCSQCGYKMPVTPTPEPTATPTPEPTATPAPTARPVEDTEDDFVPTPRPQSANRVTPEPTVAPTPEPTAAPMVDTLLSVVAEAQAEGSTATVEVVGAQEIMTETEYETLKALPAQEQILVTLASIGFEDVVEAAMQTLNVSLSEDAQGLVAQVTERMAVVTEEERAVLEEKLTQYFPVEEVVIDGVKTSYFVLDLRIEVDGVARVERYGFRLDENGEWIFVRLDLQSVQW